MYSKTFFLYIAILLALLLTIPPECYAKSSTILGSTYVIDGFPDAWEKQTNCQLADYIYNCSLVSEYTTYNWYGSSTTEDNIYEAAGGSGHAYSISFYIGHGREEGDWNGPF